MQVQPELQGKLQQVAGFELAAFPRPSLPGTGRGLPFQFVLVSDADYAELDSLASQLIDKGMVSGNFMFLRKSIDLARPRTTIQVDRDRAGALGIDMREIGRSLSLLVGDGYVNRFSLAERSYKVIPQVARKYRLDHETLNDYYVRSSAGGLVPLGDALAYLEGEASALLPPNVTWDYLGEARQYTRQGSALVVTFFLSLLVIYLVLAAQFESWRDPLIILVAVPMSIAGAMAFLTLGFATINIYTQVGLITLIGLIAKNGILIVEFANQLQVTEGLDRRAAVERSAAIRLRPILMTTASMVVAMVPLLTASGPGAVSRFDIGLVIASGLGIGTLFTLYVVPTVYLLLARRRNRVTPGPGSQPVTGPR
jgi:multidrug efflux pump